MAIVKTIDVALRADVEKFESGMKRGMKTTEQFQKSADRIAKQMGDAAASFQHGGLTATEFSTRINELDADLKRLNADQAATRAGFAGMAGAQARAGQVMRGLETQAQRFQRELREINALHKVGALSVEQHSQAVRRLQASYTTATPGMKQAATSMSVLDRTAMLPGVGQYASRLSMLAAVGVKVGAIAGPLIAVGAAMRSAFTTIDVAGDKAIELGIEPQEFLALSFAAERVGVAAQHIEQSLLRATVAAGDAISGNAELTRTFTRLGISVQQLQNATPYETLRLVADGLENIQNPAEKASLAVDIFGRRGINMLQVLDGGSKALDDANAKLNALGVTMGGRGMSAVDRMQGAWAELKTAISGVSQALFNMFGPALATSIEVIAKAVGLMNELALAVAKVAGYGRLAGDAPAATAAKATRGTMPTFFSSEAARKAAADFANNPDAYLDLSPVNDDTQARIDGFFADMDGKLKALEEQYGTTRFKLESMFIGPMNEMQRAFVEARLQQEAFQQQIADINKLFDANLISIEKRNELLKNVDDASRRAAVTEEMVVRKRAMEAMEARTEMIVGNMRTTLDAQKKSIAQMGMVTGPAAIERGTQAAFAQFRENQQGVDVAKKQLELQKKMEAHLADLKRRGVVLKEATL